MAMFASNAWAVQMFDVALANWYGEPSGLCVHSKTCGVALAIEKVMRPTTSSTGICQMRRRII